MNRTCYPVALACLTIFAAACAADRTTGLSGSASAAVAGGNPSPLSASPASDVQISLSWQDNSPNEGGYEIHRSTTGAAGAFTRVATTVANATSWSDVALTPNTQYCYEVRAFRAQGGKTAYSPFSNVSCATTYGPPPAPATVTASPRGFGVVQVDWSASPNATSYRAERAAVPAGPWTALASLLVALQLQDNDRAAEQQVCYRIAAVNAWGETISTSRCTTPPAAPTNLAVSTPLGGGLDVAWTDASAVEGGYEVQRSIGDGQFTTIGTTPANVTLYHDATALADTRYWYRVRATKDGGYTEFSQWADGINPSATPPAPTITNAIPTSSSTSYIQWSTPATNGSGFRLERSVEGGGWATVITTTWVQAETHDDGLTAELETCYRLFAFNARGDSPPSATECVRPLAAPQNVTATPAGSDAIDITWQNASAYATGYVVQRTVCDYVYNYYYGYYYNCYVAESASLPADATSWHSAGLAAGQSYDYAVFAVGTKNGVQYNSDPGSVTGTTLP